MAKSKRDKRSGDRGWRMAAVAFPAEEVGPGVISASPEEVLAAIEHLPPGLDWKSVGPHVVPLFERVRPYPPHMPERVQAIVAPGVTIGFGIDVGPAFITVSPELIESWSMNVADLAGHALANLHAIAARVRADEVHRGPLADTEVAALQTHRGIGSVLVLAPSELVRIFGAERGVFIAPMRDLLIRFPADADPGLVVELFEGIARSDPNCLSPRVFAFDGRNVTVEPLGLPRLAA